MNALTLLELARAVVRARGVENASAEVILRALAEMAQDTLREIEDEQRKLREMSAEKRRTA